MPMAGRKTPYYSATAGARTCDLPLPLAMDKEVNALSMWQQGRLHNHIAVSLCDNTV
jgi:hypothetical protein